MADRSRTTDWRDPRVSEVEEIRRCSRWVRRALDIWHAAIDAHGEGSAQDDAAWARVGRAVDAWKDAGGMESCCGQGLTRG